MIDSAKPIDLRGACLGLQHIQATAIDGDDDVAVGEPAQLQTRRESTARKRRQVSEHVQVAAEW